ncbi:hypothetical protein SLS57_000440 [Botryosphaeria dothidea]
MSSSRSARTNSSPIAGMHINAKNALVQTNDRINLKWTDPMNKDQADHIIEGIPKPMLLKFSSDVARFYADPHAPRTYDLDIQPDLDPQAVRYVFSEMHKACFERGAYALAPYPDANVLRHTKCFIACKALEVRSAEYAWRGALMDAVRAVNVTAEEFVLLHRAFGEQTEPLLLKHVLNCVAYAECVDEVEHPETTAINRYVYASGHPELAVMKKAVEVEIERKLTERAEKERLREEERQRSLEWNEAQKRQRLQHARRQARKEENFEKARAGERALSEEEVHRLSFGSGPTMATVSKRLR